VTIPRVTVVELGGSPTLPLLVVGPSLGTSVTALWSSTARRLTGAYRVVGWDLPGHGASPAAAEPFTLADIAEAVNNAVAAQVPSVANFVYAGVSVGGAVGFELTLNHPDAVAAAALICTGAKIGVGADWQARAALVRREGTAAMVDLASTRWFAPGFRDRDPECATALLGCLGNTDDEGYALTCDAIAGFDVRHRLGEIDTPVVAIAGADDVSTPPDGLRFISEHVRRGRFVELANTGHLAPAERPAVIAHELAAVGGRSTNDRL
jgi:3-oxoadipate enol-lactonase / 4-carboxymuconolactone decarboxylase